MAQQGGKNVVENSKFAIRLFGALEVSAGGTPVTLPSRRAGLLLAALALRHGSAVERSTLAGTIWPDSPDATALHNLRQTLAQVRRVLGPAGECLRSVSPRSIVLESGPSVWIDAAEFDDAVGRGDVDSLRRAAELYRGPLLQDCDEPFAIVEREARDQAFLLLTDRLGAHHAAAGESVQAIVLFRRAIAIDPYRESSVRGLMAQLALSGENAAALDTYRRLAQTLRRELRTEPGLETKTLYRTIRSEAGKPRRTMPAGDSGKPCLPRPLSPLIGREEEAEEVAKLLDRCRLVTLTGVGGVGKTRLALAVAESIGERDLDEPAFADLSPVQDVGHTVAAIARAVGAPEFASQATVESLGEWLRERYGLIVVDNCEHLVEDAADVLERLLSLAPRLRVLATSRQPLGVSGERVYQAPPLAVPSPEATPEEVLRTPAVRLFLDRASPSLKGEIDAISSLCRRLDGIPLALELAAARTQLLSVEEIEARLEDRFALLGGSQRSVPRHRTLQAAMDWSWDLLTEPERDLLKCLSVFRGGASLGAVEAVAKTPVLDLMTSLVDRSLVRVEYDADGSRFALLETVREYAASRRSRSATTSLRERHSAFFSGWAQEASGHFRQPDEVRWFERLERDHDNLRAALEWYGGTGRSHEEMRLAVHLSRFWDTHGHLAEGRARLERALREAPPDAPPDLVAAARGRAGWMATVQHDCEAARHHYTAALDHFRQVGDRQSSAFCLSLIASANYLANDFETAQRQYEEALALQRELGMMAVAIVLVNLGEVALRRGDLDLARRRLEESFAEAGPDAGSPEGRGNRLSTLAVIDLRQGRYDEAREHAIQALRLFVEAQSFVALPHALGVLGVVEGALGRWAQAARLLGAEEGLLSQQGLPPSCLIEPEREDTRAECVRALGEGAFRESFADGRREKAGLIAEYEETPA